MPFGWRKLSESEVEAKIKIEEMKLRAKLHALKYALMLFIPYLLIFLIIWVVVNYFNTR